MLPYLKSISQFIDTLEYIPRLYITHPVQRVLHAYFPDWFPTICHKGDFLCWHTNGAIKLANGMPKPVIDGLDWVAEHPYESLGMATAASALLVLSYQALRSAKPSSKPLAHSQNVKKTSSPR
jgi:hypothetical protein